jgi:hypothetical protein
MNTSNASAKAIWPEALIRQPKPIVDRQGFRVHVRLKSSESFMGIDVHTATSAELTAMAERELGAFIAAVTELFGSAQAKIAADDWIEEFVLTDSVPSTTRDCRRIAIGASVRFASRLHARIFDQLD